MSATYIFHKSDQVQFLQSAREKCAPRFQELVDRLSEFPYLTVATSVGLNAEDIKILEDGKTYWWPASWFKLSKPFKPAPIDDLI